MGWILGGVDLRGVDLGGVDLGGVGGSRGGWISGFDNAVSHVGSDRVHRHSLTSRASANGVMDCRIDPSR